MSSSQLTFTCFRGVAKNHQPERFAKKINALNRPTPPSSLCFYWCYMVTIPRHPNSWRLGRLGRWRVEDSMAMWWDLTVPWDPEVVPLFMQFWCLQGTEDGGKNMIYAGFFFTHLDPFGMMAFHEIDHLVISHSYGKSYWVFHSFPWWIFPDCYIGHYQRV